MIARIRNRYSAAIIILLLAVPACRETGDVRIISEDGLIYFEPNLDEPAVSVAVYSLTVAKDDCEENCILWSITRKDDASLDTPSLSRPIAFGATPAGFDLRQRGPARLAAGRYYVSVNVGYNEKRSDAARTRILYKVFSLTRSDTGVLHVTTEAE